MKYRMRTALDAFNGDVFASLYPILDPTCSGPEFLMRV